MPATSAPIVRHLTHTGVLAGRPFCGAATSVDGVTYAHPGFGFNPSDPEHRHTTCPFCLAFWEGADMPSPIVTEADTRDPWAVALALPTEAFSTYAPAIENARQRAAQNAPMEPAPCRDCGAGMSPEQYAEHFPQGEGDPYGEAPCSTCRPEGPMDLADEPADELERIAAQDPDQPLTDADHEELAAEGEAAMDAAWEADPNADRDTLGDAVHGPIFGRACNAERWENVAAADLSDAIWEGIGRASAPDPDDGLDDYPEDEDRAHGWAE